MPAPTSSAAAAVALIWARAPAPSVTLTASARPRSGSALAKRSRASHDTGGTTSAVMTKRPAARRWARLSPSGEEDCVVMDSTGEAGVTRLAGGIREQDRGRDRRVADLIVKSARRHKVRGPRHSRRAFVDTLPVHR